MNLKHINEIKGVIFDLDNTLVSSSLDFKTLKQSIGCCSDEDILEFVNKIESGKKLNHDTDLRDKIKKNS